MSLDLDPNLCFVLMPMTDKFKKMYNHVIKPMVTELELDCLYAGEIFGARPIMADVWQYCAKARVVIAELTGANPNVYYEAGYSHAFDSEKVIFITQQMDEVTFDVRHFRCIEYDPHPGDVDQFQAALKDNISAVLAKPPEGPRVVTRVVEKTVEVPASLDVETQEALFLHRIVRYAERGHSLVADERVPRLLKVLEAATTVRPTITLIKPGQHAVVNVAMHSVLNVHSQPDQSSPIVGAISPYGRDVEVTGDGHEVDGEIWVPIRYENNTGWANSNYLARQVGSVNDEIGVLALQMIMAIKHEDMDTLATLVHPDKGVRFSPYACVGGWDLIFSADQLRQAFADDTTHRWGADQGSGDPIDLTFRRYYERFIYDVDFARPDVVYFNEHWQSAHLINNIPEVYPEATTVEYHFDGIEPEYHGWDWRGLRLVLEEEGDNWYLVGIVHDARGI